MRPSTSATYTRFFFILTAVIFLAGIASAAVNGALQTTDSTGTVVNGNIYASKSAVYITGGPQNTKDPGLVPDGTYYFQVTDPSGSVLLSLDDISCRQVVVSGGRITGVPTTAPPLACVDGYHNLGTFNLANQEQPIQLCNPDSTKCPKDFADTPNPGGEYKTWLTPVADYSPTVNGTVQDNCSQPSSHVSFGFCDSDSKTDNFKIRAPGTASITACKFIDVDNNSTYDPLAGDYLISGWQITATGVDGGTVTQTTNQDGCTTFTYTFPKGVTTPEQVTLTEVQQSGWNQVAPTPLSGPAGSCTLSGSVVNGSDTCSVTNGVITATISPNDIAVAPFFGNAVGAALVGLEVSKTASGGNNFTWNITKSVDKTEIDDSNGTTTFNYTVTVTHDAGTGWQVQGSISVYNPNISGGSDGNGAIDGVTITDNIDNSGTCNVNGTGTNSYGPATVNGGDTLNVPYTCTFTNNPGSGINAFSVAWDPLYGGGPVSNSATYDFTSADTSVNITDTIAGSLGSVAIQSDNSTMCAAAISGFTGSNLACNVGGTVNGITTTTFTYSETFTDPAGTCTAHNNTATFTTNTNTTGNSNQITVTQCVGKDLTVSKTATAGFSSSIAKKVDKTKVEQSGGNITFNYTVTVSESLWTVSGNITLTNPNDWESISATVGDALSDSGGVCSVNGGSNSITLAAGGSTTLPYTCSFAARPAAVTGTNTASATVTAGIVPDTTVYSLAVGYTFATLTVTDTIQSSAHPTGCLATLGTVSVTTTTPSATPGCGVTSLATPSWGVFTYSITDSNASPGTCSSYDNTAQITGGSSSNTVTVTACNIGTGALTMGFWKNSNGAKIINAGLSTSGVCNSGTWLRLLNPYKDLSPTATCKQVTTYVSTVIGAATCGGSTCNPMLRAQMLATALDVYFSDPALGGNQIGAYNGLGSKQEALGGVAIDLSHLCNMTDGSSGSSCTGVYEDARPEFGIAGAPCLGTTVSQMLGYANYSSGANGSPVATANTGASWYNQNKAKQVFAKDGFDNTNNQIANIVPPGPGVCSPTF